jgi:hypothetical protein
MNPRDEQIQRENLQAFEKMLSVREDRNEELQTRRTGYRDLYGNQYLYTTHRQDDGKFHCLIKKKMKSRIHKKYFVFRTVKSISFVKRKTANAWCLKKCHKAQERQRVVLARREEGKTLRKEAKKLINTKDVVIEKKIKHLLLLVKKADKRIKANETRKKSYQKKVKYYNKKLMEVKMAGT